MNNPERFFSIANQAAVATTAALATTFTGLLVGNPLGSGVRCKILEFGYAMTLAGSKAGAVGLMTGSCAVTAITASLTPAPIVGGGPTSKVLATAGQTIATPVLNRICGGYGTLATTTWSQLPMGIYIPRVPILLKPGRYVATYTTLDTTASFIFHFVWEEVLD